ncbi:MAG: anthranilate synthase component I family protein [Sphingobacteriales bacterium]|nr:anthranilate synthase component I family protein [Sphingobacteriales bacterium]
MLNWAQAFSTFCFLDNHQYPAGPHAVECLLAAGVKRKLSLPAGGALQTLQSFLEEKKSWLFGHLGYDLKNETEALSSGHPDHILFPDLFFFEPEILVRLTADKLMIEAADPEAVYRAIQEQPEYPAVKTSGPLQIQSRFTREAYLKVIRELQQHILRGDCYEINFCQEFFAEQALIDPLLIYQKLSAESPNPFSAFYRVQDKWLICASPERFIKKTGHKILSQPIKGTAPRIPGNEKADREARQELYRSAKERAENVMVVDLVRNDLSRVCREGSVKVDELYGIYSFPQVYQMISTVSGELEAGTPFAGIIRAAFPMGSMTGAPKKRVMQLIEQYERTRRGIFSGAVGYINPGGDFDFNVVIRSILYNATNQYLSVPAGSAITHYSQAEAEWEECLLKVAAIKKVLGAAG